MTTKYVLFGIILASLATPTLAANVEFYVVKNTTSNKCAVKEQKLSQYPSAFLPTNANTKLVSTTTYKTLVAAKAAMKTDPACAAI